VIPEYLCFVFNKFAGVCVVSLTCECDNNLQVVLVEKVFGESQARSWKKLEHVMMCMIPTMTQTAR